MPFFLYLDLIKMRLEIMLSDFTGKKETFFGIKKKEFFEVQKNALFQKTHAFGFLLLVKKCDFFNLFRFGQNKSRNNA